MKLSKKFNSFVGKRIKTHEDAHTFYSPTMRRHMTHRKFAVSGDCPVIRDIFKQAAKDKLYVRFWGVSTPASGPTDKSKNRLNIFFQKEGGNNFSIKKITRG